MREAEEYKTNTTLCMFFIITHIIKHILHRRMKPKTKTLYTTVDRTFLETLVQYKSDGRSLVPAKAVQIVHRTPNEPQDAP